jgi:hypothetical protein
MRLLHVRLALIAAASAWALLVPGIGHTVLAADGRATISKDAKVIAELPKDLQGLPGKLELYGKLSAADPKGIVLSITKVDREYPGNQFTNGQPYFAAAKDGDPEAWLVKKTVRLLWQKDGFGGEQEKKIYENNKSRYKAGQSLRILAKWSDTEKALTVVGATWFGGPEARGKQKRQ